MDNPVTLTISDTQDVTKQNKTEHKRKLEMMNNTNSTEKTGSEPRCSQRASSSYLLLDCRHLSCYSCALKLLAVIEKRKKIYVKGKLQ